MHQASGKSIFSVGGTNNDATYGGVLSQTGTNASLSLLKIGTGAWTLSGVNTFATTGTGTASTTTVRDGSLIAGTNALSGVAGAFGNSTTAIALRDATTISSGTAMNPKLLIGGVFNVGRNITVGANNNALGNAGTTFTIGGSTANASTFSGVTTLNQNLSVTQVTDGTLNLMGNITSGSSGTQTLTFNNAGSVAQSTGAIGGGTGTIAVTQAGAGTTTLSGANTYTGATTVDAGILLVSGSISGSTTTVNNTGTLGGAGGTTGAVIVNSGGTLSPGASIGTLNTTGDVTLNTGATFKLEIDTTAATTDLHAITGNLSLAETDDVVLTITDLTPAAFTSGTLTFITYTGTWNSGGLFTYNGNVIADDGVLTVGANQFTLDYNFGGNSVVLIAIPEPGAAVSLLGGLGVLLGLQRFRRRARTGA